MNALKKNPWIAYSKLNPNAKMRLFCFPYAGGSASVFHDWQSYLPNNVQVCPIEMPGRGYRLMETPFDEMTALINATATAIKPYLDLPFAFFGHSLGALVSYELAVFLKREYNKSPTNLIVSGRQAPPIPDPNLRYNLPQADLVAELKRMGGTPTDVLENEELLEFLLPMIRADLKLDEAFQYQDSEPLNCPITVFGGLEDPETTSEGLEAWKKHTNNLFSLEMFSGNHFFINSSKELLLNGIGDILDREEGVALKD